MDDLYEVIGNNRIEDVSWICSLSEPELDLLIGLKKLVILRAKAIGHVELAEKFDLKMLRAIAGGEETLASLVAAGGDDWAEVAILLVAVLFLSRVHFRPALYIPSYSLSVALDAGLVVMEHFRQKVKDLPPVPGMDETSACIDGCNLLKSKLDKLSIEELKSCLGMKKEKHYFKR
ncbi:unnamed protein product [Linum tenue]|uniref:Uncharacterized protein n=1 Tax=Linum tenue TaxID=586396 RepID=A0AAV0KZM2_9ROSI|nr:unnamed protein product [Linum tenue]